MIQHSSQHSSITTPRQPRPARLLAPALAAFALQAGAQTADQAYSFTGTYWMTSGQSQAYSGSFSIVGATETDVRPPLAADVAHYPPGTWAGESRYYTGAVDLTLTFASGTTISASTLDIVVNDTTLQGPGSPYPLGLSVQIYATDLRVQAPSHEVCDTPTGVCGPDDDPLYHDANQAALMGTEVVYFAGWGQPNASVQGVPVLTDYFFPSPYGTSSSAGMGFHAGPTTLLTQFKTFESTPLTSPVPEPASASLWLGGLAMLLAGGWRRRQDAAMV